MQIKINSSLFELRQIPKKCPICHHAIAPKYSSGVVVDDYKKIDLAFQCTNCQNMFIGKYKKYTGSQYSLYKVWPIVPESVHFENEIKEVSPMFVETYNQAIYAESNSLHQLTGIGLRKSLEFLIKDFLISQGNEEDTIKNSTLSQCINNFIDDNNLVEISKRATWLGNDETHYVRKWENKDINDLKILIKLTVNWIHNIILKDKYIAEMS